MEIVEFLERQLVGLENDVEAAWEADEMRQSIRHLIHRDVAAKREIIDIHPNVNDGDCGTCVDGEWGYPTNGGARPASWPCSTLKALAQPFAGQPDFDAAWKVSDA